MRLHTGQLVFGEIELIRLHWEQLNAYHHAKASHFKANYELMTFEDRQRYFGKLHESGQLRPDLAMDLTTGKYVSIA